MRHGYISRQLLQYSLHVCFVIFSVAALSTIKIHAQEVAIRGSVVDAETNQPLPGVNVFIDQTSLGSATDIRGRYAIEALTPGSYVVVASMIGFEPASNPIEIRPGDSLLAAHFSLNPSVTALDTLTVVQERPHAWYQQLGTFLDEFLGASGNGKGAEILNPYYLDFVDEDGVLTATAAAPLVIRNHALGYRITYILSSFKSDRNEQTLNVQGRFHFEELVPENERQQKAWDRRRDQAFRGSLQHLLWSLVRGVWRQQGFIVNVYKPDTGDSNRIDRSALVLSEENPLFTPVMGDYLFLMRFPDYLHMVYGDEQSWIDLPSDMAHIHESGYVYAPAHSPGSLVLYGDLTKRRLADLLPRDYGSSLIYARD